MKELRNLPQIVNVTDLRYRWAQVEKELERSEAPIVVVEHSTPKAVIFPFDKAQRMLGEQKELHRKDPLIEWREKYAASFANWDATDVIRKQRDSRWNLS